MGTTPANTRIPRHAIDGKLRFRLIAYTVAAIVMLGITIFHVLSGQEVLAVALFSMAIGAAVGIVGARMYHVSWDKDAEKVIARLDVIGIVVLVAYLAFSVLKNNVLATVVPANQISAAAIAVTAGVMVGRVLGTRGHIRAVFEEMLAGTSDIATHQ